MAGADGGKDADGGSEPGKDSEERSHDQEPDEPRTKVGDGGSVGLGGGEPLSRPAGERSPARGDPVVPRGVHPQGGQHKASGTCEVSV